MICRIGIRREVLVGVDWRNGRKPGFLFMFGKNILAPWTKKVVLNGMKFLREERFHPQKMGRKHR